MSRARPMSLYACLALAASCGAPPETEVPADEPTSSLEQELKTKQGTELGVPPAGNFLRLGPLTAPAGAGLALRRSSLRFQPNASDPSTFIEGEALADPSRVYQDAGGRRYRITSVRRHRARTDVYEYAVEVPDPGDPTSFIPLCTTAEGAPDKALAIPGVVQIPGPGYERDVAPASFFFACKIGVAAKCIDFRYEPWRNWSYPSTPYEQCLYFARADYCGDGRSNTLNGTDVDVYDVGVLPMRNERAGGLRLEAVWVPVRAGLTGRNTPPLLCLSKKRWDTLPAGDLCSGDLEDPRLRETGIRTCPDDSDAPRFCEERSLDQWLAFAREKFAGTIDADVGLLVNDSSFNDAGLVRWQQNGAFYVTSRYDLGRHPIGALTNMPLEPSYRPYCTEGKVFSRELPTGAQINVRKLYTYTNDAGARVTTTQQAIPPGFSASGERYLEGFIYRPTRPGNLPATAPWPPPFTVPLCLRPDNVATSEGTVSGGTTCPSGILLGYLPNSFPCQAYPPSLVILP